MFRTEFFVCGIAPFGKQLVALSYDEEGTKQEVWQFMSIEKCQQKSCSMGNN